MLHAASEEVHLHACCSAEVCSVFGLLPSMQPAPGPSAPYMQRMQSGLHDADGVLGCRYAMMLEDMRITKWAVEKGGELEASAAEAFLADL